jgi:DNA-binding transcriptional regulator YiaG
MAKRYKNEILMVLHQEALANFEVGAISEKRMREWDNKCLVQEPKPAQKTARAAKRALASV